MSKIKIYELADKLGVERKELLSKAQEFGISAKSTSKTLSDAEVLKLENIYKKSDISEPVLISHRANLPSFLAYTLYQYTNMKQIK